MKAPNVVWSAVFVLVVFLAEYLFGRDVVATAGAGLISVLGVLVRMWQEYQQQTVTPAGTRSVGPARPGYWRRVLIG